MVIKKGDGKGERQGRGVIGWGNRVKEVKRGEKCLLDVDAPKKHPAKLVFAASIYLN